MFNLLTLSLALAGCTFVGAAPQFIDIDISEIPLDPYPTSSSTAGIQDDILLTEEDNEYPIIELPDANYRPYLHNVGSARLSSRIFKLVY